MNPGQKVQYVGKSGQVKKWATGEYIGPFICPTGSPKSYVKFGDKRLLVPDDDLQSAYIYASDLPLGFAEALDLVRDQVRIRVHWPEKKHSLVEATFSENGLILPCDARPIASKMWDWAAEMWFPELQGNLTPEGTVREGDGMKNSRRDVVLAALRAGFPLTDYAKEV